MEEKEDGEWGKKRGIPFWVGVYAQLKMVVPYIFLSKKISFSFSLF